MEESKDCEIIFCNKSTYKFNSKDLAKALEWCQGKNIWAISTPWGAIQPMPLEEFENVRDAMFDGPAESEVPEDLI